ncbi:MAG: hypothetical protein ABIT16_02015 [Croceibacterium sp.]
MTVFKRLLLALAVILLLPSQAMAADSLTGSWALRLDGANIMRFDLEPDGEGWKGAWVKPSSFATDGKRFGRISLPPIERKSDRGATVGDWAEITFDDPRPNTEPDVFRFHLTGANQAEMIYVGTGLAPYVLERVGAGALLGPFETGKVYGGEAGPSVPSSRVLSLPPGNQPPVQGPSVQGR